MSTVQVPPVNPHLSFIYPDHNSLSTLTEGEAYTYRDRKIIVSQLNVFAMQLGVPRRAVQMPSRQNIWGSIFSHWQNSGLMQYKTSESLQSKYSRGRAKLRELVVLHNTRVANGELGSSTRNEESSVQGTDIDGDTEMSVTNGGEMVEDSGDDSVNDEEDPQVFEGQSSEAPDGGSHAHHSGHAAATIVVARLLEVAPTERRSLWLAFEGLGHSGIEVISEQITLESDLFEGAQLG